MRTGRSLALALISAASFSLAACGEMPGLGGEEESGGSEQSENDGAEGDD